jgi:hypothetical protein
MDIHISFALQGYFYVTSVNPVHNAHMFYFKKKKKERKKRPRKKMRARKKKGMIRKKFKKIK